jgi:hypothetical protein
MAAIPTTYMQTCHVCGRWLQIPVQLFGMTAACQHCEATFAAHDPACHRAAAIDPRRALMQRIDELLRDRHECGHRGLVESAMRESEF